MTEFSKLKTIFSNYKNAVDALGETFSQEAAKDSRYSDTVQRERQEERAARYNREIDDKATRAEKAATLEVERLKESLKKYITSGGNPATVQTLQVALASGLELSDMEITALSTNAGYLEMRLLQQITGGKISPPDLRVFNDDLLSIKRTVDGMKHYRGNGSMAAIGGGGLFGQSSVASSALAGQWLEGTTLDTMAARWETVLGGDR